jgi:hypothetical protein
MPPLSNERCLIATARSVVILVAALTSFQCIAEPRADPEVELRQRILTHLDALAGVLSEQSNEGYIAGRRIANASLHDVSNLTNSLKKQRQFGELMGIVQADEASEGVRGRLVTEIISKANTLDSYATHVRALRKLAMTAPLDEVIKTLKTSYVPPEVSVVVGNSSPTPGGHSTTSTGQPLPYAAAAAVESGLLPFIVGLGDSTVDYPAVAAVLYTDSRTNGLFVRCTGTLVAPHVVLTAQHCLTLGDPPRAVYFQHAGLFEVATTEVYPNYQFPINDLAVLFLSVKVTGIAPMPISRSGAPRPKTAGRIVGFGFHSSPSGAIVPLTGIKVFGDVSTGACPAEYAGNHVFCWSYSLTPLAASLPSSTCSGDSGGPIFIHSNGWQLAGVTSGSATGGALACRSGDTAINSEISYYASWIDQQVSRNVPSVPQIQPPPAQPLLPAIDNSSRFLASATQGVFDSTASWSTTFELVNASARVIVGVNGTPSGAPIHITVGRVNATPVCSAIRSDNTAVFCELSSPAIGPYTVAITGAPWQEYQLVTTSF